MRPRISGVMFHNLKGVSGWSQCQERQLDVSLVQSGNYHKRLFTIFDREYPYTVTIDYKLPRVGASGGHRTVLNQLITVRLVSEQDCIRELTEISEKQKALDMLADKLQRKAQNYVKTLVDMPKLE